MKKINFVNKCEKKKAPAEKKFFYIVLSICAAAVLAVGLAGTLGRKSDDNKKHINSKEVLKSSSESVDEKTLYNPDDPSYDVIIPGEREKTDENTKNEINELKESDKSKQDAKAETNKKEEDGKKTETGKTEKQPEIPVISPQIDEVKKTNPAPEITAPQTNTEVPEITQISYPVSGNIMKAHSNNVPVFSKTMNDYRVHNGIDISCKIGTEVKACADGVIKEAYLDKKSGNTVVIDHKTFQTVYSNLASLDKAKEGGSVKSGDVIGVVGDTAKYEIGDSAHLHFEVIKDGVSIDPKKMLKK